MGNHKFHHQSFFIKGRSRAGKTLGKIALITISIVMVNSAFAYVKEDLYSAFLIKVAKFITWDKKSFQNEKSPFIIGIIGKDPLYKILRKNSKKATVSGRSIEVKKFETFYDISAAWNKNKELPCHILFVSRSEKKNLSEKLKPIERLNILTVSELENFTTPSKGIMRLFLKDNRIRFELNIDNAEKSKIKFSSKLLKLATITKNKK